MFYFKGKIMLDIIENKELALACDLDYTVLVEDVPMGSYYLILRNNRKAFVASTYDKGRSPSQIQIHGSDELALWKEIFNREAKFDALFSKTLVDKILLDRANILLKEGWEGLDYRIKSLQNSLENLFTEILASFNCREKSKNKTFRGFVQEVRLGRKPSFETFEVYSTIDSLFNNPIEKRSVSLGISPRLFENNVWDCTLQFNSRIEGEYMRLLEEGPFVVKEVFTRNGIIPGNLKILFYGSKDLY